MKRFISKIILLVVINVILFIAIYVILCRVIYNKSDFTIKSTTAIVVAGASHSACSIDTQYIEHTENLSRSGEAYSYTYAKLKELLSVNHRIDTVMIEITNLVFCNQMDEWYWSDKYLQYHFVTFCPFLSINDHFTLFKHHPKAFIMTYPIFVKDACKKILTHNYEYAYSYGGHESRQEIVDTAKHQDVPLYQLSYINKYYLDKIVELCKAKHVKLIFMRSPMHPKYIYWQTEPQFQNIIQQHYSDIEFWDYGHALSADTLFADYQHLNQNGAVVFSTIINQKLHPIE